jgi:hypothetical protein
MDKKMTDSLSSCAQPGDFLRGTPTAYSNRDRIERLEEEIIKLAQRVEEVEKFMFMEMNFQIDDPEEAKKQILEVNKTNPSSANMLQSMLNKWEEKEGLPLTKLVEPIVVLNAKDVLEERKKKEEYERSCRPRPETQREFGGLG